MGSRVSFGEDENFLKLVSGDGCPTVKILKPLISYLKGLIYCINYSLINSLFKFKITSTF
jgi:hypothetical protein